MIMDTIACADAYTGLGERLARGLRIIREMDFSAMEDGEYPLDGKNIFATLSTYTTKTADNVKPEAHRKYIDIQYLIRGREYIGYAPLQQLGAPAESLPDQDLYFYSGETCPLLLTGYVFHIYFPHDAHAPCIAAGSPGEVRKAVIKIAVDGGAKFENI